MTTEGLWDLRVDHADDEAVQAERKSWWDKICPTKTQDPPGHWKGQITAWIDEADFEHCNNAAIWFAGSILEVVERGADGQIMVYGAGYWERIGA